MNNPLISIIVPVYNVEKFLDRCVNSLINQTYEKLEIILINDGSTDNSPNLCDVYARKDSRIKVIHKSNGGVSSARNCGLKQSIGEYVLFVDADDWLETTTIEVLVKLNKQKKYDIMMFEYSVDKKNESFNYLNPNLEGEMTREKAIYNTITPVNRFCVTKMYRKQILNNLEFNINIHLGEDTLFACQAIANSNNIYFLSRAFYHYFQSDESATRKKGFNQRLLTGQDAYLNIMNLCKKQFPTLESLAILQYLEILIWIMVEMYKDKKNNKEQIRLFQKEIHKWSCRIGNISEYTLKKKIKLWLCKHSLTVFMLIHNK